jgi:protein tyrosine phosphatase (PTP) superfamily phosphohydrolase (DUF442 family)
MISPARVHHSRWMAILLLFGYLWTFGCGAAPVPGEQRPDTWAKPIEINGIANTWQLTDTLFRGEQPTVEGFRSLHRMGIRTVVNLRRLHNDTDELNRAGLPGNISLVHIPMNAWDVSEDEIVAFLQIVTDDARHPVFFHCRHGSDRTGIMAAAYRMVVEHWTAQKAIDEMKHGGFGYHTIWRGLPETLASLDVSGIRHQVLE